MVSQVFYRVTFFIDFSGEKKKQYKKNIKIDVTVKTLTKYI